MRVLESGFDRKRPHRHVLIALTLIVVLASCNPAADLRLPLLISDGMVVQRDTEIPMWGWARPGQVVSVSMGQEHASGTADADGRWRLLLPPKPAGGPFELEIVAGNESRTITDVMVGDVWVASGQSNMQFELEKVTDAQAELAAANDPMVRQFKVPHSWAYAPEHELAGGEWVVESPETSGGFTAVGHFFAQELRKNLDVPIGIINATWDGSAIEAWISASSMGMSDADQAELEQTLRQEGEQMIERVRELVGEFDKPDEGLVDGVARWADPDLDDSGWASIPVPAYWEFSGYDGMNGIAWYRTTFQLSAEQANQDARLSLGPIDDSDITWINGVQVGSMIDLYSEPRIYSVPASALREGENTLAVRVEDPRSGGGIYGDPDLVFFESGSAKVSLAGEWKFKPSDVSVSHENEKQHTRTLLYNKRLTPLFNASVTGVIWYQGERNATAEWAFEYRDRLKAMIGDWRAGWGDNDLPFLVVQLPNYMAVQPQPSESDWATIRESQSKVLDLPRTGLAVTIDVGEAGDLHPPNKKPVGIRLAKAALAIQYGKDIVYSGPIFKGMELKGDKAYISFDHVGSGLEARGGKLAEFSISGDDGRFVWAEARIKGDQVVVWSPRVKQPAAVRYAWASNPERANLYNKEGFPASPFRTDGGKK